MVKYLVGPKPITDHMNLRGIKSDLLFEALVNLLEAHCSEGMV